MYVFFVQGPTYKNLEIKVLPSHEVTPAPLGIGKKKRPRFVRLHVWKALLGNLSLLVY